MDCIKIKIDSFDKLVSLIKSTYDNFLYRAYNEHLKQQKNIVYSSIDTISVLEEDMFDWLNDRLFEFGCYDVRNDIVTYDLAFMNLNIIAQID